MWLRLRDLRVAYIPRTLAAFRWHPYSKSATSNAANWQELLTIVRRHGGTVSIVSSPGEGTEVQLRLPRSQDT